MSFFIREMEQWNFRVLNLCKFSYSLSAPNLEINYLTGSFKNLDSTTVERVIIKCNHTTIFVEMNYIT